jgi:hypothetical protein
VPIGIHDAGSGVTPVTPHSEEEMSRSEVIMYATLRVVPFEIYSRVDAQLERAFKVLEGVALDGEAEAASSCQNQLEGS